MGRYVWISPVLDPFAGFSHPVQNDSTAFDGTAARRLARGSGNDFAQYVEGLRAQPLVNEDAVPKQQRRRHLVSGLRQRESFLRKWINQTRVGEKLRFHNCWLNESYAAFPLAKEESPVIRRRQGLPD